MEGNSCFITDLNVFFGSHERGVKSDSRMQMSKTAERQLKIILQIGERKIAHLNIENKRMSNDSIKHGFVCMCLSPFLVLFEPSRFYVSERNEYRSRPRPFLQLYS